MRPIIEAEERLETLTLHMAASGHMEKGDMEKYLRELRQRADARKQPQRAARPQSLEDLARIGGTQLIVVENSRG